MKIPFNNINNKGKTNDTQNKGKKKLKPLIFLYDKNVLEYDTTNDDDIYKIDIQKLDKRRISRDPDKDMKGCYCYSLQIATCYFTLVDEGTGEER